MANLCNMTRKTRTRQTRIHAALQSGYCAICHIPYNSLDDHIQSKKHLKLIGEDANYISINGFIDQNSLEPYLNLNDVNGRQIEKDFCPRTTRMNKNRGRSMDRIASSPIDSPMHHHLRSRKQINYAMSPSMDEDSFSERPDLLVRPTKERRSQSRVTAKKSQNILEEPSNAEVWNSGRPKRRSCIRAKRVSADERLVVDNKTYYKVEVMTNKLRSSSATKEHHEVKQSPELQENERDEKGLIVKFKKLRNSEITLLNNEAENFLFPKKDDSSSSEEEEDEEDVDADGANTTLSSCEERNDSYLPSSDNEDDKGNDVLTEDEASMDSTTSSGRSKKRRRTQAEAFIMDNQKYYKFETPGSRLRYHGSFFSEPNLKSPKRNGDMNVKEEKKEEEVPKKTNNVKKVDLDNYKFSFEMIPTGEKWFEPFRRQDLGEESYMYLSDIGAENRFILPYQIGAIPALDPKICIAQYSQLKKMAQENSSRTSCSTPDRSETNYSPSLDNELMDEDSKSSEPANSIDFCSENSNSEEVKSTEERSHRKRKLHVGRNPRKSPRQHASTLAILSSLIQQRKKKTKLNEPAALSNPTVPKSTTLPTIPEEGTVPTKAPPVDYEDILVSMNQDWDSDKLSCDLEPCPEDTIEFSHRLGILDVLKIYDDLRKKDDYKSNRRFISGSPVNKSGRRKKINKTGWPNRKKGLTKKDVNLKEETSSVGSVNDSEEEQNATDCNKDVNKLDDVVNRNCDSGRAESNTKTPKVKNKVKISSVTKNINLQPFVKVKKLDSRNIVNRDDNVSLPAKRTYKRRMPASPKSPRMLRKPRGRWYKER
ncbi:uncharacterized protein LOC123680285 isoform X2 [Harmonia axyridis]|uniref:uncharacterized protein LOC123680285 isoform X2 n=1 Tax=Harmonia axyridis TaxID=115357 RepID=UPI001E27921B|nr:uncharacterized protein LOC123680285 isoform X2 [Harmonia axyridis]